MKHEGEKENGNSLWVWSFIKIQPIRIFFLFESLPDSLIFLCGENLITATPPTAAPKQEKEKKSPSTFITAATRQWPARQVQKQKSARFMGISLKSAGDLQSVTGTRRRSDPVCVSLFLLEVKERQIQPKKRPPSPPVQSNNSTSFFKCSFFCFWGFKAKNEPSS